MSAWMAARVAVITLVASIGGVQLARADADLAPGELPLATQAARAHYDARRAYFEQGDLRRAIAELTLAKQDDDRPTLDIVGSRSAEGRPPMTLMLVLIAAFTLSILAMVARLIWRFSRRPPQAG